MATGELPSMFLPLLALRVTRRKWSCCVCRVILGLETISRGISKASWSALLQMGFERVNLAHGINVFMLSNSKELWRKTALVFFCFLFFWAAVAAALCALNGGISVLHNRKWMWGKVHHLEWLSRRKVGCPHRALEVINKTTELLGRTVWDRTGLLISI